MSPGPCDEMDHSWVCKQQLPYINVQRFRGGLVCKAHRLLYHSTLDLRVVKKKKSSPGRIDEVDQSWVCTGVSRSYEIALFPRTIIGPWAYAYCRIQGGRYFV